MINRTTVIVVEKQDGGVRSPLHAILCSLNMRCLRSFLMINHLSSTGTASNPTANGVTLGLLQQVAAKENSIETKKVKLD